MAKAAQKHKSWPVTSLSSVVVWKHKPETTDENLIIECFETDKTNVHLKSKMLSGKVQVQFPVPSYNQTQSEDMLKEVFRELMTEYVSSNKNVISVELDKLKTWTKKKFCETLVKEFVQCATTPGRSKAYPVTLTFDTAENHNFDEAIKGCEAALTGAMSKPKMIIGNKKLSVVVETGSLDKTKADALACAISSDLDLLRGLVSAALLKRGGKELQEDLDAKCPSQQLPFGEIVTVPGHRLDCNRVLFGVMYPFDNTLLQEYKSKTNYYRVTVCDFMFKCLDKAERRGLQSIAFPALGAGILRFPTDIVADEMFESVISWSKNHPQRTFIKEIRFVIYTGDKDVYKEFKTAAKKHATSSEVDVQLNGPSNSASVVGMRNHSGQTGGQTSTFFLSSKDTQPGKKVAVGSLPIPKHFTPELLQIFCEYAIEKIEHVQCEVRFQRQSVIIKGPVDKLDRAMEMMKDAIDKFKKEQYQSSETLDLNQSNFSFRDVLDKLGEIKRKLNVDFFINKMKSHVAFFGKQSQDAKDAKDMVVSLLLPPRETAIADSGKPHKDGGDSKHTQSRISNQFSWSTSTKAVQVFETKEKIIVKVYSADILRAPVDCIVNAANINLQHGGGIAKAIAKAAGKDLTKEGRDYLKDHGKLRVGEACYTGAGKMPYAYVIHAVGPCWSDYYPHTMKDVKKCEVDLYNAVINSLTTAEKKNVKMIAVSSISSGIYACPLDLCSVQYAKAVLDYSKRSHSPLKEIHFVDTNMEMVKTIQETFQSMIPGEKVPKSYNKLTYVKSLGASNKSDKGRRTPQHTRTDEPHLSMNANYTSENWRQSDYAASSKSGIVIYPYHYTEVPPGLQKKEFACCFGEGQLLSIYTGDILSVKNVDIVVCGIIPKGKTEGKLSKAISEKGGVSYESSKKEAFKKGVKSGDVVLCKSENMNNIKWIAHAVLYSKDDKDDKMHKLFMKIFDTIEDNKCHSLAIPLIGTGTGKRDPVYCAERLIDSLVEFCSFNKTYRFRIHLINIEKDKTNTAVDVAKKFVRNSRPMSVRTNHATASSGHHRQRETERPTTAGKPTHIQQKSNKTYRGDAVRVEINFKEKNKETKGSRKSESQWRMKSNRGKGFNQINESPDWDKPGKRNEHRKKANSYGAVNLDESDNEDNSFEEHKQYDKKVMEKGVDMVKDSPGLSDAGTDDDDDYHSPNETPQNKVKEVEKQSGNLPIYHVELKAKETTNTGENEPGRFEEGDGERGDNSSEEEEEEDISEETHSKESDNERDQDDTNVEDEVDTCVICMDDVTDPKVLPCGHVFCTDCIDAQFAYKKVCPTCGKVCGIITGDQPEGTMNVRKHDRASCAGYEDCVRIEITYRFPDGTQGANHPSPGTHYKGITRTAYLPDNKRGREICEMLKVAYDRKLVFTIGRSRTTGADGVITWNDIHHKTDSKPNTQFGYPDPTYLDRVTEELEIKGVTLNDIPTLSEPRHRRR